MSDENKPLNAAEIEELRELADLFAHAWDWTYSERAIVGNALPRLLAMLTPPADAEALEAVEHCEDAANIGRSHGLISASHDFAIVDIDKLRIILSYVRAAQAPRLAGESETEALRERVEVLEWWEHVRRFSTSWLLDRLERTRLAAGRTTAEQGEFIMGALDEWEAIKKAAKRAAFPELGEESRG